VIVDESLGEVPRYESTNIYSEVWGKIYMSAYLDPPENSIRFRAPAFRKSGKSMRGFVEIIEAIVATFHHRSISLLGLKIIRHRETIYPNLDQFKKYCYRQNLVF
jgi:hypothetical protein